MKCEDDFRLRKDWLEYLRYYYAGLAMQAVCTHYMIFSEKDREHNLNTAVALADKLIEKLEKKNE